MDYQDTDNGRNGRKIEVSTVRNAGVWQGMNWIRQTKRLAIYLRDSFACVYCGTDGIEDGAELTIDHVISPHLGGVNADWNLVTACASCNRRKFNVPVTEFATAESLAYIATLADSNLAPYRKTARRLQRSVQTERADGMAPVSSVITEIQLGNVDWQ